MKLGPATLQSLHMRHIEENCLWLY